MKMEEYQFDSDEIAQLKTYRDNQPDTRLQRRFLSLIMLSEGVNIELVMKVFDISHTTLQRWRIITRKESRNDSIVYPRAIPRFLYP